MNRSYKTLWLVLAALVLVAVGVYVFVLQNSGDAVSNEPQAWQLDETGQSPRVQPLPKQTENGKAKASDASESASQSGDAAEAEGAQASDAETSVGDLDEEAREYDKNGQAGDPPAGWKDDYAHWDSWIVPNGSVQRIEQIGLIQKNMDDVGYLYQPAEKRAQRMKELDQEAEAAAEKGLISENPKDGYVRLDLVEESGTSKTVYAAPDFADRFREIWDESISINKAGMVPIPILQRSNTIGWGGPTDRFKIT